MSSSATSSASQPSPRSDWLERQLARLDELSALATTEGDSVSDIARARALELLALLAVRPASADIVLDETFVTLIGGGGLQLEWQVGPHYAEIEVRANGNLSWLTAEGASIGEAVRVDRQGFIRAFEGFCSAPAAA